MNNTKIAVFAYSDSFLFFWFLLILIVTFPFSARVCSISPRLTRLLPPHPGSQSLPIPTPLEPDSVDPNDIFQWSRPLSSWAPLSFSPFLLSLARLLCSSQIGYAKASVKTRPGCKGRARWSSRRGEPPSKQRSSRTLSVLPRRE